MKDRILAYCKLMFIVLALTVIYLYNNHAVTLMLLIALLVILVTSAFGFFLTRNRLTADISFHTFFTERGHTVKLILKAKNPSVYPHTKCVLRFRLHHTMEPGEYTHEVGFTLLPKQEQERVLTLSFDYCGVFRAELFELTSSSLFNLAGYKKKTDLFAETVVLPSPVETEDSSFENHHFPDSGEEAAEDSGKGEDRSEIFEIRDYIPGDELQTIHWKLSAKADVLMVKEFSEPLSEQFTVYLEQNFRNLSQLNAFFDVAFTIISFFQQQKLRFSVAYIGDDGETLHSVVAREEDIIQLLMQLFYDIKPEENSERTPQPLHITKPGFMITCSSHPKFEGNLVMNHKNTARVYRITK